ncbi:MAG: hypothetical protein EBR09_09480 [Proteobacteria bacterium]|nr:hypothetical protein [Pseudomonadota bacterium]
MKTHRKHFLLSLFSMAAMLSVILAACGYVKVFNGSGGKKLKWNSETGYQVETETSSGTDSGGGSSGGSGTSDADKVAACVSSLSTGNLTFSTGDTSTAVTGNITLPGTISQCSIAWSVDSSAASWVSISGNIATVTRAASASNGTITLTGALTSGSVTQNKSLTITILRQVPDSEAVATCVSNFSASPFTFASGDSLTNINSSFTASTTQNDCSVSWSKSAGLSWVSIAGGTFTVTPAQAMADETGIITATISRNANGGASDTSKTFIATVKRLPDNTETNACAAAITSADLTFAAGDTASTITQNFTTTARKDMGTYSCAITWSEVADTSSALVLSGSNATVTRPPYTASGNATVQVRATATGASGYTANSSPLTLTVLKIPSTNAQEVEGCKNDLTIADFTGAAITNSDPNGTAGIISNSSATGTFTVPTAPVIYSSSCTISWSSGSTPYVSFSGGTGTYNNFHDGDVSSGAGKTITVTATISSGATTDTKAFTLAMTKRGDLTISPFDKSTGIGGGAADRLSVTLTEATASTGATVSYKVCVGPDGDSDLSSSNSLIAAAAVRDLGTCTSTQGTALPLGTTDTYCCTTSAISGSVTRWFLVPTDATQTWRGRVYSYISGEPNLGDHKILYDLSTTAVNP